MNSNREQLRRRVLPSMRTPRHMRGNRGLPLCWYGGQRLNFSCKEQFSVVVKLPFYGFGRCLTVFAEVIEVAPAQTSPRGRLCVFCKDGVVIFCWHIAFVYLITF